MKKVCVRCKVEFKEVYFGKTTACRDCRENLKMTFCIDCGQGKQHATMYEAQNYKSKRCFSCFVKSRRMKKLKS